MTVRINSVDSRLNLDRHLESTISTSMESMLEEVKRVWKERSNISSPTNTQQVNTLLARVSRTAGSHQVNIYTKEGYKPPQIDRKNVTSGTSEENSWLSHVPLARKDTNIPVISPKMNKPMQWGRTKPTNVNRGPTPSWGHTLSSVKKEPQLDMKSVYALEELHSDIQDTFYDVLRNSNRHLIQ